MRESESAVRDAENVRTLVAGLLRRQEQERRQISRELHDGINQRLAALSMALSALESQLATPAAARERLLSIEDRVVAILDDVRRISHQLYPSILEHAGFAAALRSHCREFSKQAGVQTHFATDNVPEQIDQEIAASLFRLSQEALRNVAKHSGASEVEVSIAGDDQGIRLRIVDNGRGFDVARARTQGGLGLNSMNERARALGGRFSIDSGPPGGATVAVWVPLSPLPAVPEGTRNPPDGAWA